MAKKSAIQFVCQQCGAVRSKWSGRCDNCGAWNSFVEQASEIAGSNVVAASKGKPLAAQSIATIAPSSKAGRIATGISDVDVVLGGGIVPASVILIAGQPGIGKSTLPEALMDNIDYCAMIDVDKLVSVNQPGRTLCRFGSSY